MTVKFTNNASSTLSSGINSSVTSLTVASASAFPQLAGADDYCYLTIQQATGTVREVVKATALSSNTFTIIRAQDNTTAQSFSAGDTVELRMTAALLTDVIDAATVEGVKTNFQYTPIAGQTVFSGADNSSNTMIINQSGLVNVYMNGVRLVQGTDYTVSAANNEITLTTGATTADIIDIEVYGNFTGQSGAAVAITGGSITGTAITATTLGASGTATLNTFVSNNATISGGTINNVAIGGTTQAAGAFTSLTSAGLTVDTTTLVVDATNNRVGIGTSSPGATYHLLSGSPAASIHATTNASTGYHEYRYNTTTIAGYIGNGSGLLSGAADSDFILRSEGALVFNTSGNNRRVTIDSSGRVGIGTSSPNSVAKLQVEDITASNTSTYISVVSGNGGNAGIIFGDSDSDLRGGVLYNNADNALRFFGKNAFSEAGRFDVNGNFLVGGTDTDPGSTGNSANAGTAIGASGYVSVARTGGSAIRAGRIDSDGAIIEFFGDGSLVGSIGTETSNSDLYIGNGDTAIMFHDGADAIFPHNASTNAGRDAAIDIGYSTYRFKDLYLSGGVNFNGSSGGVNTANRSFLMDEYEIGTCTIGLNTANGDASLSRQDNAIGYYQKTGDICTVQFYSGGITFSAAGSGTARVTGLPFNNRGGIYDYGVCSVTHNTATTTDIQNGYSAPNHNFITLIQPHTTTSAVWITSGVRYFMFSITYLTT